MDMNIYFGEQDTNASALSFSFIKTSFLTGTFTIHYKDGNILELNQTISPHIIFKLSDNTVKILKGANITATRLTI